MQEIKHVEDEEIVARTVGFMYMLDKENNRAKQRKSQDNIMKGGHKEKDLYAEASEVAKITTGSCQCSLNLGVSKFTYSTEVASEDPILEIFKECKLRYEDPHEKKTDEGPIMEILSRKTKSLYLEPSRNNVIAIPPDTLPLKNIKHGFYSHNPENCVKSEDLEKGVDDVNEEKKDFAAKYSEARVHSQVKLVLENMDQREPAFVISNYNTISYLQEIKQHGLKVRREEAEREKVDYRLIPLTEEETKCAEALRIDLKNITDIKDSVKTYLNISSSEPVRGNVSCDTNIFKKLRTMKRADLEKLKQQIEGKGEEALQNLATSLHYENEVAGLGRELDIWMVLPIKRQIIDIEVKSADDFTKNIHQKLKEAAGQIAKRKKILSRMHEDILDCGWTYTSAVALPLLTSLEDWEKQSTKWHKQVCNNCRHFILDSSSLRNLNQWFAKLKCLQPNVFPVDHQYDNLLIRMIGFLLVSDSEPQTTKIPLQFSKQRCREMNEDAVVGERAKGHGLTTEKPMPDDVEYFADTSTGASAARGKSKKKKNTDMKPTHLSSLRTVVLWNKAQLDVLQSGQRKVIFDSDFGCGKTLLLKSCALHLAKGKEAGKKIFFISCAAAHTQEYDERWDEEKMMDMANKDEFQETGVQALSLGDVLEYYEAHLKDSANNDHGSKQEEKLSTRNLDEVLRYFMLELHPTAHFFIDEIPSVGVSHQSFQGIKIRRNSDVFTWIALRPALLEKVRGTDRNKDGKNNWRKEMEQDPYNYFFPLMEDNMRNSAKVVDMVDRIFFFDKKFKSSATDSFLPANTVPGNDPVIITTDGVNTRAVRHAISTYYEVLSEPVVVLAEDRSDVAKIYADCQELTGTGRKIVALDYREKDKGKLEEDKKKVREFIKNPEGVLITDIESFGGMQARNIIVFEHGRLSSLKNCLLRSTTSCIYIHYVQRNTIRNVDLARQFFRVDETFMKFLPRSTQKKLKKRQQLSANHEGDHSQTSETEASAMPLAPATQTPQEITCKIQASHML